MRKHTITEFSFQVFGFLILLGFVSYGVQAQSIINASGGSNTLSNGIFDYSIGEMTVISTHSTSDITVTQGLLQMEATSLGVSDQLFTDQNLRIFPNPVKTELFLQPAMDGSGELSVQLFDLQGRHILQKDFFLQTGSERQQLDLSALQEATYMLNVQFSHGKKLYRQTYKVLKSSRR